MLRFYLSHIKLSNQLINNNLHVIQFKCVSAGSHNKYYKRNCRNQETGDGIQFVRIVQN